MRNYGLIFGGIAALVIASIAGIYSNGIKLGIDLSGGTILVYQVKADQRADRETMDELILALQRRVNPEGVADIPIRPVGSSRIEIILANATSEEVELLKRKITDVGSLEFLILANHKHDQAAINRIDRLQPPAMFHETVQATGKSYRWVRLGEVFEGGTRPDGTPTGAPTAQVEGTTQIRIPDGELTRDRYIRAQITLRGQTRTGAEEETRSFVVNGNTEDLLTTTTLDRNGLLTGPVAHGFRSISYYRIDYNPSQIEVRGLERPLPEDPVIREWDRGDGRIERYILVEQPRSRYAQVTGEYLARTYPTQDERFQPAVGFVFNGQGARNFGNLTRSHLPEEGGQFRYRLAIVLDDLVRSAPAINSEIRESGIIEGVQPEEVDFLIEILKAGSLPATIDPTPLLEEKIGPTLGRDTISKGVRAILISLVLVPLFMIVYYRFAGLVSVIALLLNVLLLIASMSITGSAFTLPGLAGLALTIAMAVDANVLIFERMREEQDRGAGVGQQIRNGFDKAWTTILDSNVTTILAAAVLWWIGTAEIKGFALTLIIGLLWNLLTAVYISRAIFDFTYSRGWLKKLTMMRILHKTRIDFVGPRHYLMAASAVLCVGCLLATAYRGQSLLNIDFTGGTLVTIHLDEEFEDLKSLSPADRAAYVRSKAGAELPDVSVETLNLEGELPGYRFNIRTTEDDVPMVQNTVAEAFGPALARIETTVGAPEAIQGEATDPEAPAADGEAAGKADAPPAVQARFAGGQRFPLSFNRPLDVETVQTQFVTILEQAGVANPTSRFALRVPSGQPTAETTRMTLETNLEPELARGYLADLSNQLATAPGLLFDRLENFGGAVANEARLLAIVAIVLSWLIMITYLWFRFKSVMYGVAAVLSLVHDVLIALGAVALSPYKIDLPMVAAFLTLIGYSVNDTIVIFDRIRENRGKSGRLTPELVNAAINQTLSRTILTSVTSWLVVVVFFLFGGEGLRGFSFLLVVGFLSGVYSTIYIAAPILIDWSNRSERSTTRKGQQPAVAAQKV